jgi:2-polyprenyl-3-methyl-5-hydroxy-6-metoxy-1,4-benzoquinol methylase
MLSNEDLCLPTRYSRRSSNQYFVDLPTSQVEGIWQPDVYPFAAALARRMGVRTIVDLGCGSGEKVAGLSDEFETIGVDFGPNLRAAREVFPHLSWMDLDLESDLSPLTPHLSESLVICSDVIEHLQDPRSLLRFLSASVGGLHGIVMSTPERGRARGPRDLGPPANPAHTMEWSLEEFGSLLEANGLHPLVHGYTRNFSGSSTRNTQVAFIPGQGAGLHLPRDLPTAIAYVPCFNENDVIRSTIDRLLMQGFDVHVLDNWSSDGTWELLSGAYAASGRVKLERYPEGPIVEFDWSSILERIDALAAATDYDWVVHVDADEQLDASIPDLGVLDVLGMADSAGYDVVDFTLVDFRPETGGDFTRLPTRWQFATRPGARTLERAWRNRRQRVGIAESGGHAIPSPKRVFPLNLVLRHYPLRSPEQARRKIFQDRLPRFTRERAEKGWHIQYDGYEQDSDFLWSPEVLEDWDTSTPREWTVEFSTRAGIEFDDFAMPPGFTRTGPTSGTYAAQVHSGQGGGASMDPRSYGAVEVIGQGVDYLDGAEQELLEIMAGVSDRSSGSDQLVAHIRDWPTKYHLSPQRENLLLPITFNEGMTVLDVGCGTGALTRKIAESGAIVVGLEGSHPRAEVAAARVDSLPNARIMAGSLADYLQSPPQNAPSSFDVIVVCGVLEYSGSLAGGASGPTQMLRQLRQLLKPTGSLLLAIENQWGLKYLLSYPEDHLGQPWIGVEGYWQDSSGIRTWARESLSSMLDAADFDEQSWFAAYPDYKLPSCLVHESMFAASDGRSLVKQYVRTPTSDDAGAPFTTADAMAVMHSAIDAGLGMDLANSFVVVCGSPGNLEQNETRAGILTGVPQRARAWRSARALTRTEEGWRLRYLGSPAPSSNWPLRFQPSDVPVVVGANVEDLVVAELARDGLSSPQLTTLLKRWWVEAQAVIPSEDGSAVQFDAMPSNFIVDDTDTWHFVDPEFIWQGQLDPSMLGLRSLAWTAQRLARRTGTIKGIASGASAMSVGEALCHLAEIQIAPDTRAALLDFESVLQSKVAGHEDREHLTAMRRNVEDAWLSPISAHSRTLPFLSLKLAAERSSRELERSRADLQVAQDELARARATLVEIAVDLSTVETRAQRAESQLAEALGSRRWRFAERLRHPLQG